MKYKKPSWLHYKFAQFVCGIVARFIFKFKILRNEIKDKKGPFVVIANHQAAYDFVNLIGLCKRPMSFVISNSFYSSLPIKGFLAKMGVIPKQQFQTATVDLKRMKRVVEAGEPLVIYPAGLMCEDGVSTTIPRATYKFLKWLDADIYVAKVSGTYFAMPKWGKGFRPGRTTIDVYKLFSKEELKEMDVKTVQEKAEKEILFDAYREQEELRIKYGKEQNIENLENVLYICPHCHEEFTMAVENKDTIACTKCGYTQQSDEFGFMHHIKGPGKEIRYVSDWSKFIFEKVKEKIQAGENSLSASTKIQMIDSKKKKFVEVGHGTIKLSEEGFFLQGVLQGEDFSLTVPITGIPMIPFGPGKYIEIHKGMEIYRCVLDEGKLAMKFVNMLKVFYELGDFMAVEKNKMV